MQGDATGIAIDVHRLEGEKEHALRIAVNVDHIAIAFNAGARQWNPLLLQVARIDDQSQGTTRTDDAQAEHTILANDASVLDTAAAVMLCETHCSHQRTLKLRVATTATWRSA